MPRKSEQEWAIIEDDYIRNPVIYEDLSREYNISAQAICAYSLRHNWDEKRKKYIDKTLRNNQGKDLENRDKKEKSILQQIEELVKLKSKAELLALSTYLTKAETSKALSPIELMQLINKSKDGISELTKVAELLKGNATDRTEFTDADKDNQARQNRLALIGNN